MNPYNPEAKCPKCGHSDIKDKYHWPWVNIFDKTDKTQEKMSRTCINCGFEWAEKPLDAE